jgi:hypothetical protein
MDFLHYVCKGSYLRSELRDSKIAPYITTVFYLCPAYVLLCCNENTHGREAKKEKGSDDAIPYEVDRADD